MKKLFDKFYPYKGYMNSYWEKKFSEHWSFGPLTIYGLNAMHLALNLATPWGYFCFHPTFRVFGKWWPWYVYLSKDATPNRTSFKFGYKY